MKSSTSTLPLIEPKPQKLGNKRVQYGSLRRKKVQNDITKLSTPAALWRLYKRNEAFYVYLILAVVLTYWLVKG